MAKKDLKKFMAQNISFIGFMLMLEVIGIIVFICFCMLFKDLFYTACFFMLGGFMIIVLPIFVITELIKAYREPEEVERKSYFLDEDYDRCMRESQKCDEARAERCAIRFLP